MTMKANKGLRYDAKVDIELLILAFVKPRKNPQVSMKRIRISLNFSRTNVNNLSKIPQGKISAAIMLKVTDGKNTKARITLWNKDTYTPSKSNFQ